MPVIYWYQFHTSAGPVSLLPEAGGRYKVMYDGENLGSYLSAAAAADDVGGGHTFSPSNGADFEQLGVSQDLGDWEQKVFADIHRLRPG
jgi:hypothetical protein